MASVSLLIPIKPTRLFGVLRPDQRAGAVPATFVPRADVDYWIACGWAVWAGKYTVRLRRSAPLKLRDESASIRPSTMHAAACGSKRHQAMVEAWR